MDKFINLSILRNPLNWLTIGTMIVLVIVSGLVIYSRFTDAPSLNDGASNLAKET